MESTPPAMWEHISKVYKAMENESTPGERDGVDVKLYQGFTTKLFQEAGIPVPYYGKILKVLEQLGSITQLRRGGGTTPSLWVLWREPDLQEFMQSFHDGKLTISQRQNRLQMVEARLKDIEGRIPGIDVGKALIDLQNQIDDLKRSPV